MPSLDSLNSLKTLKVDDKTYHYFSLPDAAKTLGDLDNVLARWQRASEARGVVAVRVRDENLADLPRACDSGCKKGSQGQPEYWQGYKLHLDVIDGDIPISAVLTSASTHDSQVAIPLMQMSAQRVTALYQLMDAAYCAEPILAYARCLGQVPIVEPVKRGDWIPLDDAQRRRFGERTASERVNARLKDHFGGRTVRVRGAAKVMCHLMFGIVAITALGLWQRLC